MNSEEVYYYYIEMAIENLAHGGATAPREVSRHKIVDRPNLPMYALIEDFGFADSGNNTGICPPESQRG